jgi:hypothetical protein
MTETAEEPELIEIYSSRERQQQKTVLFVVTRLFVVVAPHPNGGGFSVRLILFSSLSLSVLRLPLVVGDSELLLSKLS